VNGTELSESSRRVPCGEVQVTTIAKQQTAAPVRILRGHPAIATCSTVILSIPGVGGSLVICLPSLVRNSSLFDSGIALLRLRDDHELAGVNNLTDR
jgi:hypothetical protein